MNGRSFTRAVNFDSAPERVEPRPKIVLRPSIKIRPIAVVVQRKVRFDCGEEMNEDEYIAITGRGILRLAGVYDD